MFAQVTAAMLVGSLQLFPCWGAPPLNDNFADRTVLEGDDLMIRGTLLGASLESDSDGHSERGLGNFDRVCGYSLDLVESGSLWWSWRAPRSGAVFLLPNEVRAPSAYCSPTFACWDSDRAGPRFPLDDNPEGPIAQLQTGTERPRYP